MSALHQQIRDCTMCAEHLPDGVRPIVQFSSAAQIVIIGQAPGSKVHKSGIPWDDDSGDRLRDWTGLSKNQLYDAQQVAIVPMGFCYPGKASGGDKPPRKECAPQWHDRVMAQLPKDRLTLLVGTYAQAHYLPAAKSLSMTERVRAFETFLPDYFPIPHPAWRSRIWAKKNPWFGQIVLPKLRTMIAARIR